MYSFLISVRKVRDGIWQEGFLASDRQKIIQAFHDALLIIMRRPPAGIEGMKLYKRVLKHSDKLLVFMTSPTIPADNNGAERAIRNAKIRQKVSGCFRNPDAAKRYAIILSVINSFQISHKWQKCQNSHKPSTGRPRLAQFKAFVSEAPEFTNA